MKPPTKSTKTCQQQARSSAGSEYLLASIPRTLRGNNPLRKVYCEMRMVASPLPHVAWSPHADQKPPQRLLVAVWLKFCTGPCLKYARCDAATLQKPRQPFSPRYQEIASVAEQSRLASVERVREAQLRKRDGAGKESWFVRTSKPEISARTIEEHNCVMYFYARLAVMAANCCRSASEVKHQRKLQSVCELPS